MNVNKESIFEYKSYKDYLKDQIASQPKKGRGFKTALAKAAACQVAYISQVLGGNRHFTFEQAEGINSFLGHGEDEARFFLLLLSFERAGTPALRARHQKEMNREIQRQLVLKERFKAKDVLSLETQATYYSAWYYAAIHVALTLPPLRTKDTLTRALKIPLSTVTRVLEFLTSCGLAVRKDHEYLPGTSHVYLGSDSPMISQHHTNWRTRAISSLDPDNEEDLHYSAVVSVRAEDYKKIREILTNAIGNTRKRWLESKDETELCAITVDWFKLYKE